MPYVECPNCGQKSLRVATRCPRCGLAFEDHFVGQQRSSSKPSRLPLALLFIGTVAALLVANAVLQRPSIVAPPPPPRTASDSTPPPVSLPRPPTEPHGAAADSVRPVAIPPPRTPSEALAPVADSARPAEPTPKAEPVATAEAQRRYASIWVNVRADRSGTASVIRILRPGDLVLVDSLERGWYRVVNDRRAVGYVDGRYLDASPPP